MRTLRRQASYALGKQAEHQAVTHLTALGYHVLEQRYKTPYGEIDLIACQENLLVFVEVKARPTHQEALESISPRQAKRIMAAANHFLTTYNTGDYDMRFDVITVSTGGTLQHIEHALEADIIATGY
jgi:putative endonuclease